VRPEVRGESKITMLARVIPAKTSTVLRALCILCCRLLTLSQQVKHAWTSSPVHRKERRRLEQAQWVFALDRRHQRTSQRNLFKMDHLWFEYLLLNPTVRITLLCPYGHGQNLPAIHPVVTFCILCARSISSRHQKWAGLAPVDDSSGIGNLLFTTGFTVTSGKRLQE